MDSSLAHANFGSLHKIGQNIVLFGPYERGVLLILDRPEQHPVLSVK